MTRIDPIRYARGVFERVNRWVPIKGDWTFQRKLQKARTLIVLANVFCSQLFHVSQLCRANVERRHLDRSRALQEATDKRRVVGLDKTRLEKKEGIVTELGGAAPRARSPQGTRPHLATSVNAVAWRSSSRHDCGNCEGRVGRARHRC